MGCRKFNWDLFYKPEEYEETPLRDRKQELPNLYRDDVKVEFIKDAIALANTARQWGQPAYLLYGLDNAGNPGGISSVSLEPYRHRANVPSLTTPQDLTRVMEQVRHQMSEAIGRYITPSLNKWDLHWDEQGGRLFAYLLIEPLCPEMAFHVAQDLISGKNRLLRAGGCWIRSGESKTKIERHLLDLNTPGYLQVPYIPPSGWLKYFEALRASEEVEQAVRKTPYIDLQDQAGNLLKEVVWSWLKNEEQQILVIEGPPGSGKSTFLCRFVAEWADAGIEAMRETTRREEFRQPVGWVPVYFRLRELAFRRVLSQQKLAKEILRKVNSMAYLWKREPLKLEQLLEAEVSWLVCFDGLDELWEEQRVETFLGAVRELCRGYPALKVLISTRPLTTIPDDIQHVQIRAFSEEQIRKYLQAVITPVAEPIYHEVTNGLSDRGSQFYELKNICATPLYLEALASLISPEVPLAESLSPPVPPKDVRPVQEEPSSGDGDGVELVDHLQPIRIEEIQFTEELQATEAPSHEPEPVQPLEESTPPLTIGWILDRMIRRVWDREASRRSIEYNDLNHWWRATGELALDMDGHRRFVDHRKAMRVYSSKKGLRYVLNLSILCTSIKGIGFSHNLFQHYFGASYLQDDADLLIDWESRCTPDFWRSVMTILNQIQYSGGVL